MRSLRSRLGASMAGAALLLTLGAGIAIAIERWQEETNSLGTKVELATFRAAETTNPAAIEPAELGASESFAIVFDQDAGVMGSLGQIPNGLLDALVEDIWVEATEQDTVVSADYAGTDGSRPMHVSGVACVNPSVCDSVIIGAFEVPFSEYVGSRWPWLAGTSVAVALLVLAAARWLVGRSLRPVERMRSELDAITSTDLDRRVAVPKTRDELQQLGESLNHTIGRLSEAVVANERFAADAAHELRSPITGVRAALELEASRSPDGLLDDSVRELDRASRLIDDLLVLARRQGEPGRRVDVDLDDIVRKETGACRARFSGVSIDQNVTPVRLIGDPDALQRVVTNLLENACRYGGGEVEISLSRTSEACLLRIDDNGLGVDPEDRDRVFARFSRLDASRSRSTGGSGLGLAIVQEIVADHRGTVIIGESEAGGARFDVALPLG